MKFLHKSEDAYRKNIIIIDPQTEKELCTFVKGKFETEDEKVIKRLQELKFKPEPPEVEVPEKEEEESPDTPELAKKRTRKSFLDDLR